MAISKGFDTLVGVKKAATWGTAISVNEANRGIKILSESVATTVNTLVDDSLNGTPARDSSNRGSITNAGTFEMNLKYDGLDTLIALAMYRATTPIAATKQPAGQRPYPYYSSFKLPQVGNLDTEGYFYTLAIDKQVSIHEFDSVKTNQMTISGNAGERLKISFDVIAKQMRNSGQTNTTLSALTVPTPQKYIMFEDCKFRINNQSSTALDDNTDQFYPNAFTLTLNNNIEGFLTSENDPYIDEPVRNNFFEATGSFTLPKYTSDTTLNALINGTIMKADIRCISTSQIPSVGGGAYYYAFNMYLPSVIVTEAGRQVAGAGVVGAPISFFMEKALTAPDGMDGNGSLQNRDSGSNTESRNSITMPLEIEIMNVNKINALA